MIVSMREFSRRPQQTVDAIRTAGGPGLLTHRGAPVLLLLPVGAAELSAALLETVLEHLAEPDRAALLAARAAVPA